MGPTALPTVDLRPYVAQPIPPEVVMMQLAIPRQRAVLGGVLIAAAAALAFIVAGRSASTPTATVVVARHDIAVGARLDPSDLELRRVAVDASVGMHTFDSTDGLVGSSTLSPIDEGELLQRSAVRPGSDRSGRGISFAVERDHAVAGDLRSGDSVDVLATYGTGPDAETAVLARSVRISGVTSDDDATSAGSGRLVITADLEDTDRILAIAHAAQIASLTVIRTTGAPTTSSGRDLITSPGSPFSALSSTIPGAVFP